MPKCKPPKKAYQTKDERITELSLLVQSKEDSIKYIAVGFQKLGVMLKEKEKEIEILKSQLSKSCEGCKHKLRKIQEILNSKDKKC